MSRPNSVHSQRLERRSFWITVEDGVDVFHDVAADFEELAFVFDRDQRAFDAVVLGQLERFGKGSDFLDVALDAHVAQDQRRGGDR